ncbi:MAG: FecR domain-containing protein [Ignavibacteriaceae bacterium]|nr:FecR domain-containing protein [Ignavibacteriaceae bacterium]
MIHNKTNHDLLIRIINGTASPKDINLFDEWLNQSEKNIQEFNSIKFLWMKTDAYKVPQIPDPEIMWNNINNKINKSPLAINEGFDFSIIIKIAAVILMAVSGILFYNHLRETALPGNKVKTLSDFNTPYINNFNLVSHNGEKITCVLPDSTVVHLNSQSRLDYPEYFAGNIRIVNLTGEAYFSVKHDKNRPFVVRCGNSQVTVTGTEFNIRNRNNNTKIVVAKGSVNVLSLSSRIQKNLKKGEMVQMDKSGNITPPVQVNLKYYLAWKENKLAFRHTPLQEVMAEIERTYNVKSEFRIESAKDRTITGIFATDSLEKILSVLSITLDLNISQKGMKIIIQ